MTASYIVDEQAMEIAVRLPAEYPLKPVEVKDVRRVGVDERKWKAWLLAVQQVVTNRVRLAPSVASELRPVTDAILALVPLGRPRARRADAFQAQRLAPFRWRDRVRHLLLNHQRQRP